MKFIDKEIADFFFFFHRHFFKLADYSDKFATSQGFGKTLFSDSLIALFLTTEDRFMSFITSSGREFEYVGFFCTVTKKLYMWDSAIYAFHMNDRAEGVPFHFKCMPIAVMKAVFVQSVSEKLRKPMLPDDFDISKEETYKFAAYDYFRTGGQYVANTSRLENYVAMLDLVNGIPLYLEDQEWWFESEYEKLEQDKYTMSEVIEDMGRKSKVQAVCETIRNIPDHPWNKILAFLSSLEDKVSVVVRLKKGEETCDFRVNTVNLKPQTSNYSADMDLCFCGNCKPLSASGSPIMKDGKPTGEMCRKAQDFLGDSFFNIGDVEIVTFRGKTIYQ